MQRPERKKEGLEKVEGDAVMLTPCSVCVATAREGRSTLGPNLQGGHVGEEVVLTVEQLKGARGWVEGEAR